MAAPYVCVNLNKGQSVSAGPDGWKRWWLISQCDMTGGFKSDARVEMTIEDQNEIIQVLVDHVFIYYIGTVDVRIDLTSWPLTGRLCRSDSEKTTVVGLEEYPFTLPGLSCPTSGEILKCSMSGGAAADVAQFHLSGRYAVSDLQDKDKYEPQPVVLRGIKLRKR